MIVEEFLRFDLEITLLTVRQRNGNTLFCSPIGHEQEEVTISAAGNRPS